MSLDSLIKGALSFLHCQEMYQTGEDKFKKAGWEQGSWFEYLKSHREKETISSSLHMCTVLYGI